MRHGAKGSDFYFWCLVKIHCISNYLKDNEIFLLQNVKSYFATGNFESNPPSTANKAKFDCLDLSGPPCSTVSLWSMFGNRQIPASIEGKCRRFQNSSECLKTRLQKGRYSILVFQLYVHNIRYLKSIKRIHKICEIMTKSTR